MKGASQQPAELAAEGGARSPRVGIIGASARRQGLGPYMARFLAAAGAELCGLVSSSPASAEAARRDYRARLGLDVPAWPSASVMIAEARLDALVIASPHPTHGMYLAQALEQRLHTLCEKPLLWGVERPVETAERLVEGFRAAGRVLMVNCQWPQTLPAFAQLYPGVLAQPLESFFMRLSPVSTGLKRLADCLPHPLSMLQTLQPGGSLWDIEYHGDAERLSVRFQYGKLAAPVAVHVRLERCDNAPRPAGYAINGRAVRRRVELPAYAQFFEAESGSCRLEDPLKLQLESFLQAVQGKPVAQPDPVHRLRLLETLAARSAAPASEAEDRGSTVSPCMRAANSDEGV